MSKVPVRIMAYAMLVDALDGASAGTAAELTARFDTPVDENRRRQIVDCIDLTVGKLRRELRRRLQKYERQTWTSTPFAGRLDSNEKG